MIKKILLIIFLVLIQKFTFAETIYVSNEKDHNISVIDGNSLEVIKTVQVDQYTDIQTAAPKREQRYTVTPNPATSDADDDFGFSETTSFFQDAKDFDLSTGTDKTSTND